MTVDGRRIPAVTLEIIASAAYVDDELSAEFGRLPPAFLPIGHDRLYHLQATALGEGVERVISLPQSFAVPHWDDQALQALRIRQLAVPDGLLLGESLLYTLNVVGGDDGPVRILFGDTLFPEPPLDRFDFVAVGDGVESYGWAVFEPSTSRYVALDRGRNAGGQMVVAGYFAFSSLRLLRRALTMSGGDFIAALNLYNAERPLPPLRVPRWLDFGHLQTYYRSRCGIRTQRAFNALDMTFRVVQKSGDQPDKIAAEAAWYSELPPALRLFTPNYLGRRDGPGAQVSYSLEYLPVPSLHELFTCGAVSQGTWRGIIASCFDFFAAAQTHRPPAGTPPPLAALTTEKTFQRLAQFESAAGLAPGTEWRLAGRPMPSLRRVAELAAAEIDLDTAAFQGVMHGDPCFTNIFYDFRIQQVRFIDPRGRVAEEPTVFGDIRYDLAKLNHSITGGYDLILAGRFECTGFQERDLELSFADPWRMAMLAATCEEFSVAGRAMHHREILAITVHLFLSMLPLHQDRPDRQRAFVANALRLAHQGGLLA